MKKKIKIVSAQYIEAYKIKLLFSDHIEKIVNFGGFLEKHSHPQFDKYKNKNWFKKFKVENGNIVWGKDWDMIFPIDQIYRGKINDCPSLMIN